MKLVTKLKIFGVFATVLLLVLAIVSYWRFNQVDEALQRNAVAADIVKGAFTLTILTGDYLQSHGVRPAVQWKAQLTHLDKSISAYKKESADEQRIITQLQQQETLARTHFLQFRDSIQQQEAAVRNTPNQNLIQDLEKSLNSQLSIDVGRIVTLTSNLADINNTRLHDIRRASLVFIEVVILILGLSLILTYFLFARSITRAVGSLMKGAKVIGSGNLDFRFPTQTHDEFGELAAAFNDMTTKLKALDIEKSEFMVLASHQLRTPLSIVNWYAETLLSEKKAPLTKVQKDYLTKLYEASQRMVALSNSFLVVSKLELHTFALEPKDIDIATSAEESMKKFDQEMKEKKITLISNVKKSLGSMHVDPFVLTTIFDTLLSNSYMYTPEGGKITLQITKKDHTLEIVVTDTGIGIPQDQKEKLFTKLFRTDSAKKVYVDGVGLGLYIVKSLVTLSGGKISFLSEDEKGSAFTVTLPEKRGPHGLE